MVTLNSETCDKISVFCAACAGVVPGAAIGAAAFAIPPMIKHLRRASSLEKLLNDTSKNIKANVGEWTRHSKEYKADELASAEGAIENIIGKLQPDPKSLMNANREHKKLADRVVIHASRIADEFSRKKLPGKSQAKINRQILRIILEKTLKALEGHADYEAVLVPYFQREVFDRFDGLAAGQVDQSAELAELKSMVAKLPQAEVKAAENAGIPHSTIIKLAKRINGKVEDPDQALKELESAVEIAIGVQQKGKLGSNLDAFVSEILKRVAKLSRDGRNDEASKEVDRAYEQWQERQEREKLAGLELLDSGLKQDLLRRDATAAANRLLQKAEIEFPEQQERFEHLCGVQDERYKRGLNHGLRLELEVSVELARLTIDHAQTPEQIGAALNDLAISLRTLGDRADSKAGQDYLQQAIISYDLALEIRTRDTMPIDWAMTQMNRAIALRNLGERTGGEQGQECFQQAVIAHGLALEVIPRDTVPANWAMIQLNLATTLLRLGEFTTGAKALNYFEQAIACCDFALEIYTCDSMPAYWATTQMNRAILLSRLGERTSGERGQEILRQALGASDFALNVNTQESNPVDWAMTQMNRANALSTLGLRVAGDEGRAYLEQAISGYDLALEVFEESGMEYQLDMTRNNRQKAVDALAKLKET